MPSVVNVESLQLALADASPGDGAGGAPREAPGAALESVGAWDRAPGSVPAQASAAAARAFPDPSERAWLLAQLGQALSAIGEETAGVDPDVMSSPPNQLASLIQSFVA